MYKDSESICVSFRLGISCVSNKDCYEEMLSLTEYLKRVCTWWDMSPGEEGVLPEKFVRGVRPASQNPYPIYDQNLRFSLPYL